VKKQKDVLNEVLAAESMERGWVVFGVASKTLAWHGASASVKPRKAIISVLKWEILPEQGVSGCGANKVQVWTAEQYLSVVAMI